MTAEDEARRLSDAEIDARLAEADERLARMTPGQREELRMTAEIATLSYHPGSTRRVFRRGRRIGPFLFEQGDPEPDPPVPVRSNLLRWERHPDGLWRASFPQLTEVLPGDPAPRVFQGR